MKKGKDCDLICELMGIAGALNRLATPLEEADPGMVYILCMIGDRIGQIAREMDEKNFAPTGPYISHLPERTG